MKGKAMPKQIEFETVNVRIPKAVMDLLRTFVDDVQEYLTWAITDRVRADLEADFTFGCGVIINYEKLLDKLNLKQIFDD